MSVGGGFMADTKRLQATVKAGTMERLERICEDKGISKSAALALAIDKLWKEEYGDKK